MSSMPHVRFIYLFSITALILLAPALRAQDSTWFRDVTTHVGLDSIMNYFIYVADVDGDDYPDLILQAGVQEENQIKLFLNRKNPSEDDPHDRLFVDATAESGINAPGRIADLAALADLDNDGDVDLVTATYYYDLKGDCTPNPDNGGRCESFLNDGLGHFTLKADNGLHALGPIPGSSLSFLDYDRDGNIDLFIGTHFQSNFCNGIGAQKHLMKGKGDGTFAEVTRDVGIDYYTDALFGSNVGDWNNDCNQDIFTAIYGTTNPGNLWKNNGDGSFIDVAEEVGYDPHFKPGDNGQPMVPWAAEPYDYDNDGDMDILFLLVHGGSGVSEGRSTIFNNLGRDSGYRLVPDPARIARRNPQSTHHGDNQGRFFDFDNNGLADLVITECVYMPNTDRLYFLYQDSTHKFNDVTAGLGFITGTSAATIRQIIKNPHAIEPLDFDLDGDDDLVVGKYPTDRRFLFLRNEVGTRKNWVAVKLVPPPGVNGSAIGARITVKSGDLVQMRDIYAGQGNFSAQQPFILTFGLGDRTAIDEIDIRWPDASCSHTRVSAPPVNAIVRIGKDGIVPSGVEDGEDLKGLRLHLSEAPRK